MCSNYVPSHSDLLKGRAPPPKGWKSEAYPGYEAPFVRAKDGEPISGLGRFGLVPWWTKPEGLKAASRFTYNARSETVVTKPSFRDPWKRSQFCIIPADAIYEPRYDAGKPIRWRIERADREPMGIAGIWERWKSKETGEAIESFAMLTLNADDHELMRKFHAPTDEKPMVVILEEEDFDRWLGAAPADALAFIRQFPAELLTAREEPKAKTVREDIPSI